MGSLNHNFWGLNYLGVGQVSEGYSGFSVDLERACGGQGEEGS